MEKMILIDLETQDYSVESGIYEVACLVVENYKVVDKLYIGDAIDGYTGKKTYGYGFYDISENEKVKQTFNNFLSKYPYPLVAHNCPYDKKFLMHYNWVVEDYPFFCSMRAIRSAVKDLPSYSLNNLVKHYKVDSNTLHTAMDDVNHLFKLLDIVRPDVWIPVGVRKRKSRVRQRPTVRDLEAIDLDFDRSNILEDEVLCFTGKSQYTRVEMEEIAILNGATISKGISSKTTILIVGVDAGSKLDKAQEKDISIISDEEYMKMISLTNKNET